MKEQAIQKINKVGKISYIIAVIAKIIVIIGLVVTLAATVVCLLIPEEGIRLTFEGSSEVTVDYEAMGIKLSGEAVAEAESLTSGQDVELEDLQVGMGNGELGFSIAGWNYELADVEVNDDSMTVLFETAQRTTSLRMLAGVWLFMAVTLVLTIITLIFAEKLCKAFRDCRSPFEENVIKRMQYLAIALIPWSIVSSLADSLKDSFLNGNVSISLTVDMGVVLVVLIVLVLVYIFKYGAVLQQESDETL